MLFNDTDMAERTNRKRIRHRPHRSQRRFNSTTFATASPPILMMPPLQPPSFRSLPVQYPMPKQQHQQSFLPSAMSIHYSYSSPLTNRINATSHERGLERERGHSIELSSITTPSNMIRDCKGARSEGEENALLRDLRVFGGEMGDELDRSTDLRGPMLDVVLGLFNAVDYDDELC